MMDDETPAPPRQEGGAALHRIGEALDALSVGQLEERVALLLAEAERLRQAITAKKASREAAAAFFKL